MADESPDYCECCGRELNKSKMVWLEKSFKTNRWYAPGECPPEESQGCFPFGAACGKKVLKTQKIPRYA
jgi:hypothetical protein